MIQRIQTVYLLAVAFLFIALIFMPLIDIISSGSTYSLIDIISNGSTYSFGVEGIQSTELVYPTWSLLVIAVIIILLSFVIIFMYKKRMLQLRMCIYNELLMVGFCLLLAFYHWQFSKTPEHSDMNIHFKILAAFPFVAVILNYLAIRNIGADEVMVRATDRLR